MTNKQQIAKKRKQWSHFEVQGPIVLLILMALLGSMGIGVGGILCHAQISTKASTTDTPRLIDRAA